MSPANHALPVSKPEGRKVILRTEDYTTGVSSRYTHQRGRAGGGVMRIVLWHWSTAPPPGELPPLAEVSGGILNAHELAQAERRLDAEHGYRFAMARRGIRLILGRELSCFPQDIRFEVGDHGKPRIEGLPASHDPALSFNLSHSGDLAVLAVSRDGEVGVDVERVRDIDLRIARRYFTGREAEEIAAAESSHQLAAFFRVWTAKEAVVKATGEGIRRGLDTFEFASLPDGQASAGSLRTGALPALRARVQWFVPVEGYAAAVAGLDANRPIDLTIRAFNG